MKGEIYNPGQPLRKEDLDYANFSTQDEIKAGRFAVFIPGVFYNSQLSGERRPFLVTQFGTGLAVSVGSGTALSGGLIDSSDPSQVGAEKIVIPAADVVAGKTYTRINGTPTSSTGPFKQAPDGLGGYILTPQPTLTQNIPVLPSTTNYIWLGYLGTIDPAVYSLHKLTSAKLYPEGGDGYDIIVNQSLTPPIFRGNNNYILLATVVTNGSTVTSIIQNDNYYSSTRDHRVASLVNSGLYLNGNIEAGSPGVTGLVSTSGLSVGMSVSGSGIPTGTTIIGIAATQTVSGSIINTQNTITNLASVTTLVPGMSVSGTGIQPSTVITAILTSSSVSINNSANQTVPNDTITFTLTSPSIVMSAEATSTTTGGTYLFQAPRSYGDGTPTFVGKVWADDHFNSLGDGLAVTPKNPHRQAVTNLDGLDYISNFTTTHQAEQHAQGIIGTIGSSHLNGTLAFDAVNSPNTLPYGAIVSVNQLVSGEEVYLQGTRYTSLVPTVVVPPATLPVVFVPFTTEVDGTYDVYISQVGGSATLLKAKRTNPTISVVPANSIALAIVTWTSGVLALPPVNDVRQLSVGSISATQLQPLCISSYSVIPADAGNDQTLTTGNGIKTGHLTDECVTSSKLAPGAVLTAALANDSVTSDILAPADNTSGQNVNLGSGVKTGHITNQAIVSALVAPADGTTGQSLTTGAGIKTGHIQDDAITTPKILDGAVTTPKILDGAVTASKLDVSVSTVPVGAILPFAGATPPAGWLECDGSSLPIANNTALFAITGTAWGTTGAGFFNIPDFRGVLLRGWSHTASDSYADPSTSSRTNRLSGGAVGNLVGSFQMDTVRDHTHGLSSYGAGALSGGPGAFYPFVKQNPTDNIAGDSSTGPYPESRPKNANVMYIIRATL